MKVLHLICRGYRHISRIRKRDSNTFLNYDRTPTYTSGYWNIPLDDAKTLIGGIIYFHTTKSDISYFGGEVLDVEAVPYKDYTAVVFTLRAEDECKNIAWRGSMEKKAWSSGILDIEEI